MIIIFLLQMIGLMIFFLIFFVISLTFQRSFIDFLSMFRFIFIFLLFVLLFLFHFVMIYNHNNLQNQSNYPIIFHKSHFTHLIHRYANSLHFCCIILHQEFLCHIDVHSNFSHDFELLHFDHKFRKWAWMKNAGTIRPIRIIQEAWKQSQVQ
jgi:hypothetical protein